MISRIKLKKNGSYSHKTVHNGSKHDTQNVLPDAKIIFHHPQLEITSISNVCPFYCIYSDTRFTQENSLPLTPIGNQGQCGCCWAMSTSDAIALSFIVRSTNLNKFLPKNIRPDAMSCINCLMKISVGNQGCNGGYAVYPLVSSSINYALNNNYNPQITSNSINPAYYNFNTQGYIGGIVSNQCNTFTEWCDSNNCLSSNVLNTPQIMNVPCKNCDDNTKTKLKLKNYDNIKYNILNPNNVSTANITNYSYMYKFFTKDVSTIDYTTFISNGGTIDTWRNFVMNFISQYGPIVFTVNVYSELENYSPIDENDPASVVFTTSGISSGGHAVICVGWKIFKNYPYVDPITNKTTTKDQFCWIIKNSWGSEWGVGENFTVTNTNGFYFLASDPLNLSGVEIGIVPPNNTTTKYTSQQVQNLIQEGNLYNYPLVYLYFARPAQLYLSSEFDENNNAIPDNKKIFLVVSDFSDDKSVNIVDPAKLNSNINTNLIIGNNKSNFMLYVNKYKLYIFICILFILIVTLLI